MTPASGNSLWAMVLLTAALAASGCATVRVGEKHEAAVLFDRVPSADVVVSEAHARRDGDALVVYGKVKRTATNCCNAVRGHLDMVVIAPDGSVLDAVSFVHSPRNIPKSRTRSSRFMARLPNAVPAGATLRLAYHSNRDLIEDGSDTFACRHSAALADIEG